MSPGLTDQDGEFPPAGGITGSLTRGPAAPASLTEVTVSGQCPATRRYAHPGTGTMTGLQCKYAPGHEGDHAADPGTGTGDIFWPQEDTDVIIRVGDRATEDQLRQMRAMVDASMANPGRFVYGL